MPFVLENLYALEHGFKSGLNKAFGPLLTQLDEA
jgi:hypothetical protein